MIVTPTLRKEISSLEGILDLQPTPDESQQGGIPRTKGNKTGHGICEFLARMFMLNEQLPRNRKMSDAEIRRQVLEEFKSQRCGICERLRKRTITVNQLRQQYNRGELYRRLPIIPSFRYSNAGRPADGRTGKRPLTNEEIIATKKASAANRASF